MRRYVLSFITCAALLAGAYAEDPQTGADRTRPGPLTQVTIEGKQISGDDVYVRKNGTAYVSLSALARALGASVASQGSVAVLSIPVQPEAACGETAAVMRLSDAYRKVAVGIPDQIEAVRVLALKPGTLIPDTSFQAIQHQIDEADYRAKTEADKSVSYALSHANNTLAIMYYRLRRGIAPAAAKHDELDSELCSMDSKWALVGGRLSGMEMCSVLQSRAKELEAKKAASN